MKQQKRVPYGLGSIRQERRSTGVVFVPILPRHLSKAPPDCENPEDYRERLEPQEDWEAAFRLLTAAVKMRQRDPYAVTRSLSFALDAHTTLERLRSDALRTYGSEAQANRRISTPKGFCENWLSREPWWDLPTDTVTTEDLQATADRILRSGRNSKGQPVSVHFVHSLMAFLRTVFDEHGVTPNPVGGVRLPKKPAPRVPYWGLAQQRTFFGAPEIELADRVQMGCGMGAGLRVGELLALEIDDVHAYDPDPYLVVRFGGPDHAPPKGRRERRVELFEPGLGFFRLWLEHFYVETPSRLVFAGPLGGYQKHWPEKFPAWGKALRLRASTSHIMRHSYAVAMLSGTWGYAPQGLDFVREQLGHRDIGTTEKYYGAFEQETWRRQVRHMTGRVEVESERSAVTAHELLKLGRDWGDENAEPSTKTAGRVQSPSSTPRLTKQPKTAENAAEDGKLGWNHSNSVAGLVELAERFLQRCAAQDPFAIQAGLELAQRVLEVAAQDDGDVELEGVAL